jgi:hypothetical protein
MNLSLEEFMAEGLTSHNNFDDDSEFDRVEERVAPMDRVPLCHNGVDLVLTPANAAVRMFFEKGREYSRAMIYPGDGTTASVKLDDEFLYAMVRGGFPVELPDRPNEADEEFMDSYTRLWVEDVTTDLRADC